jgi:hypothetical protein
MFYDLVIDHAYVMKCLSTIRMFHHTTSRAKKSAGLAGVTHVVSLPAEVHPRTLKYISRKYTTIIEL